MLRFDLFASVVFFGGIIGISRGKVVLWLALDTFYYIKIIDFPHDFILEYVESGA